MNRWLNLGANLAVLIGIALVIVELRQNLVATQAQTRQEVSAGFVDFMMRLSENPELASLRRRGDQGEQLTVDERYRYETFTRGLFRYWENVHYQFRTGLYDSEEFNKHRGAWQSYVGNSPGVVDWWCKNRADFSVEFSSDFTSLLGEGGCES